MFRRMLAGLTCTAAASLLIAGCGSSGSKQSTSEPTTTTAATASPAVVADLAPTGTVRLAVMPNPAFMAHGQPPAGLAITLATELASRVGKPLSVSVYGGPPAVLSAIQSWDVTFLPVLPALMSAVDFTGPVVLVPHTLLVRAGSTIQTLAQADQPGVRIASVGMAGHTAVLAGQLKHAQLVKVTSDAAGLAMLKAGQVDAFADGRFTMADDMAQAPGSRVLSEDFFTARFAFAVAKGHAAGLSYVTELVEEMKASGAVKSAIDGANVTDVLVGPAGTAAPSAGSPTAGAGSVAPAASSTIPGY